MVKPAQPHMQTSHCRGDILAHVTTSDVCLHADQPLLGTDVSRRQDEGWSAEDKTNQCTAPFCKTEQGGGCYHRSIKAAIDRDGDTLTVLDVPAKQVGIRAVFFGLADEHEVCAICMGIN
jgi:hypothetical protein